MSAFLLDVAGIVAFGVVAVSAYDRRDWATLISTVIGYEAMLVSGWLK